MWFVSAALALLACAQASSIDCTFSSSYPRQYVAYKTNGGDLVIDGKLDDAAWEAVGFTEPFVDISTNLTPRFDTRAKIRWDDTYLYVGAALVDNAVWANITHTCHCYDPSQDQVVRGRARFLCVCVCVSMLWCTLGPRCGTRRLACLRRW